MTACGGPEGHFGLTLIAFGAYFSLASWHLGLILALRHGIWGFWVHCPQILLWLRKNGQEESRLLEYGCLSLTFQLPNLPLFTLKIVLLPLV